MQRLAVANGATTVGWLHTDIDRWLWAGHERPVHVSRQIVEKNRAEFERYGELRTVTVRRSGRGRATKVYLLNRSQVNLYGMLSTRWHAPRSHELLSVMGRIFEQSVRGELAPAQSSAYAEPSRRDQELDAIAAEFARHFF